MKLLMFVTGRHPARRGGDAWSTHRSKSLPVAKLSRSALPGCFLGALAASVLFACLAPGAHAEQSGTVLALAYDAQTRGPVPIPPSERGLQTVVADPWFKVSQERMVLEGPCFDRGGNLLFSDVSGGRVLR